MAQQPNWWDEKYESQLEKIDAREALKIVANDDRLIGDVQKAIDLYERMSSDPGGYGGPTRTQAIRMALAESLNAMT